MIPENAIKVKVVFLGESGVGKTAILKRYHQNSFSADFETTVGIDFFGRFLSINGSTIHLLLWDTAGQEKYKALAPSYIRGCSIAVLVFDVTSPESYDAAVHEVDHVRSIRNDDAVLFLVANKIDLEGKVSLDAATQFAEDNNCVFFKTSAKTGENTDELFQRMAESALERGIAPTATSVTVLESGHGTGGACFC
jgi:small GTP-binding protein